MKYYLKYSVISSQIVGGLDYNKSVGITTLSGLKLVFSGIGETQLLLRVKSYARRL